MIHLHYWPTPNGKKVTILLEELGMRYAVVPTNIGKGDQFKDEFLKISPNNRMPAMVDDAPADGWAPISVFESGAIMMYLAEKAGRFYPQDLRARYEVNQWVLWQMANQGPKLGECGHFRRLGDRQGDQSYAVRRFTDEANRLYGVLNNRLYDRRYIAGDEYTIADMISYPWTVNWQAQGQDIWEFRYFKRWFDDVSARPAVQRGLAVTAGLPEDLDSLPAEEKERRTKLLYNQRARPAPEGPHRRMNASGPPLGCGVPLAGETLSAIGRTVPRCITFTGRTTAKVARRCMARLPSCQLLLEFKSAQMGQAPGFAGGRLRSRHKLIQQLHRRRKLTLAHEEKRRIVEHVGIGRLRGEGSLVPPRTLSFSRIARRARRSPNRASSACGFGPRAEHNCCPSGRSSPISGCLRREPLIAMWKERVQGEDHRFGVPGVPAEAQKRRRAFGRRRVPLSRLSAEQRRAERAGALLELAHDLRPSPADPGG